MGAWCVQGAEVFVTHLEWQPQRDFPDQPAPWWGTRTQTLSKFHLSREFSFLIMSVDNQALLAVTSMLLMPTVGIFGNLLWNTFESLLFLFIVHPFDWRQGFYWGGAFGGRGSCSAPFPWRLWHSALVFSAIASVVSDLIISVFLYWSLAIYNVYTIVNYVCSLPRRMQRDYWVVANQTGWWLQEMKIMTTLFVK